MDCIEIERIELTDNSWLDIGELPDDVDVDFDKLWNLHPEEHGEVVIMGRRVRTPRWQQSYGRDYVFTGMNHTALPVPPEFQYFLDWANSIEEYGPFNQVLVNWYENGGHYIGSHADDERQLVEHSPILCISLGETRKFRIRMNGQILHDVDLHDRSFAVMGGHFQRELKHEIVKVNGKKGDDVGPRISITFRQFK